MPLADVPLLKHFAIHSTQAIFLREIARRSGEMRFSFPNAREDVRGMVADLLQKQLVTYVEVVTSPDQVSGPTFLVLTDAGRRAVSQIEDAERKRTSVQSDTPEIKMPA